MFSHELAALNEKTALAKRVSQWEFDDIDLLFNTANEIQLEFGLKDFVSVESCAHLRSELLRIVMELNCMEDEKIGEAALVQLGDPTAISSQSVNIQEK